MNKKDPIMKAGCGRCGAHAKQKRSVLQKSLVWHNDREWICRECCEKDSRPLNDEEWRILRGIGKELRRLRRIEASYQKLKRETGVVIPFLE